MKNSRNSIYVLYPSLISSKFHNLPPFLCPLHFFSMLNTILWSNVLYGRASFSELPKLPASPPAPFLPSQHSLSFSFFLIFFIFYQILFRVSAKQGTFHSVLLHITIQVQDFFFINGILLLCTFDQRFDFSVAKSERRRTLHMIYQEFFFSSSI